MEKARTLLLVDDEPNILSALTRMLRKEGYTIFRATSGGEGLEILKKEKVHVIVSDQRMPEMTGVDFFNQVKELYPETIRIILSGYTDLESVTDSINRGAIYRFLTKPWDDELLISNIRDAFEQYELKEANRQLTRELQEKNETLASLNNRLEEKVVQNSRDLEVNVHALHVSQDVLHAVPIPILGVENDLVIVYVNQSAYEFICRFVAVRPILGESLEQVFPPVIWRHLQRAMSSAEQAVEMLLDNSEKIEIRCNELRRDGKQEGWVFVMTSANTG